MLLLWVHNSCIQSRSVIDNYSYKKKTICLILQYCLLSENNDVLGGGGGGGGGGIITQNHTSVLASDMT